MKRIAAVTLACMFVVANSALLPSCPFPDPITHTVMFPHPHDCTKFYMCSNGNPIERDCPVGLHFNAVLSVCDWPDNANCKKGCSGLVNDETGTWTPASCSSGTSEVGDQCSLQCGADYVLKGSAYIYCTDNGWNSSNGDFIPQCVPKECIGEDLEEGLNDTLSVKASLLFVLDESGSVGVRNYQITKDFVKDIISAFPLSVNRSAGVVTFDWTSIVRVPLNVDSTSNFESSVDKMSYRGGGTNILDSLETAYNEIKRNKVHPLTLVFLITDGESSTDGTPAADKIKADGNPLFAVGIGKRLVHLESLASAGKNGRKLFYHLQDYNLLQAVGEYLNPSSVSSGSGSNKCKRS